MLSVTTIRFDEDNGEPITSEVTYEIDYVILHTTVEYARLNTREFFIKATGEELERCNAIVTHTAARTPPFVDKNKYAYFVGDEARKIILNW